MSLQRYPLSHPPILVAVTLDDHGRRCLEYAWQLAARRKEPLLVAHVVHETPRNAGMYQRRNRGHALLPLQEIARTLLAQFLEDFRHDRPELATVEVQALVVSGLPAGRIPEIARATGSSLLVIGKRREAQRWRRLLHGSVSRAVLRHAPCPVLLVDALGNPVSPPDPPPGLTEVRPRPGASALNAP